MRMYKGSFFLPMAFIAWIPPLYMPVWVTLLLRASILLYVVNSIKLVNVLHDRFFRILFLYFCVQLYSVLMNRIDANETIKSIGSLLVLPSLYLGLKHEKVKRKYISIITICAAAYFVVDAYYAFFTVNGTGLNANNQPLYFSGGKFQICYIYIVLITALMLRKEVKSINKVLLVLFGILTANTVDCSTGIVAIISLGLVQFLPRAFYTKKRVYIWFAILLLLNYLLIIAQIQNSNIFISNFVTSVLHRDIGMTGRARIYNDIAGIMSGHWFFGYGYGNSYIFDYTAAGGLYGLVNMQNGILQTLYTSGLIGMVSFIIILCQIFIKLQSIKDITKKVVLLGALTAFMIASIVEIPFTSGQMMLILGMVLATDKREQDSLDLPPKKVVQL